MGGCESKDKNKKPQVQGTTKGVSVHWISQGLTKEARQFGLDSYNSHIYDLEDLSQKKHGVIRSKARDIHCPNDGKLGAAYVDGLEGPDQVGPSTVMLSYSWGYKLGDIVSTLEAYCKSRDLDPKRTYVWICCLCNNQHRVAENKENGIVIPFEEFHSIFHDRVTSIGHILAMMSPWNSPAYLTRVWCIFELFTASTTDGCEITIVMPPKEKENMLSAISSTGDYSGVNRLFQAMASTKVQDAHATEEIDKTRILGMVKEGPGFSELNSTVNDLLRTWVKETVMQAVHEKKSDDCKYATFCAHIGLLMHKNDEIDHALELYNISRSIYETKLGDTHEYTATAYNNIGGVLGMKEDYDGALAEYRKVLSIRKNRLGENHPDTAQSHNNVAAMLYRKGNYEEALQEYRKALDVRETVLGKDHFSTATSYNNVGLVLLDQGKLTEALVMFHKARVIRETTFGENHPETATTYGCIGSVLRGQKDDTGALIQYKKALRIQEAVLGKNHPDTKTTLAVIASF